jgi:hypothetical protein
MHEQEASRQPFRGLARDQPGLVEKDEIFWCKGWRDR